ncbi:MAG: hypothetical protein JXR56_01840, partial [Candidatus Cloacimonetes bacterium]|nr:hypothetical protein [Candidatus Cloacimonadota bacterium]
IRKRKRLYAKADSGRFNLFAETSFYTIFPVSINLLLYYYLVSKKGFPHILDNLTIAGIFLLYLTANSLIVIFADRNYD